MNGIQINIWAVFYLVIAIQGFVISGILLIAKKGNAQANALLAFLILSFSLTRLQSFATMSGLTEQLPHWIFVGTPFWYLLAPLYFLYVQALINRRIRWNWIRVLHFVPFLMVVLYLTPFYVLPATAKSFFWTQNFNAGFGLRRFLFAAFYDTQNLIYLTAAIASVWKYEKLKNYKGTSYAHLLWLKSLLTFIACYIVIDFFVAGFRFTTGLTLLEMQYLPMAIFAILVYAISFLALAEPETLFPRSSRFKNKNMPAINGNEIRLQLSRLMEKQKLYRDNRLRYSDLAAQLGISVSHLSKVLNHEMGQSFHDFVNKYRVNDAKERLVNQETDHLTLLGIAYDAGFNSKASFNRIFKQHTGLTPSEFMKRHKQKLP